MSGKSRLGEYDLFLAHAGPDKRKARTLYRGLKTRGYHVFLDSDDLLPGDRWDEGILRALVRSRVMLVLVSKRSGYYDREEIASCIELARMKPDRHRVVPVYLDGERPPVEEGRYGLRRLVGIHAAPPGDMQNVAEQVSAFLERLASSASPAHADDRVRNLAEQLAEALGELEAAELAGRPVDAVREKIKSLKRRLRDGGQLKPGDVLGARYRLGALIGQGGFATVWKAFDARRQVLVAVKVLHGQWAHDKSRRERFFRGAKNMAKLDHPGIVTVVEEKAQDGGFHYFVMELLHGGDLKAAVKEGRVGPENAVSLVREIGLALQHAHERGLVHRDVKPANILLSASGQVKLTDFDLVLAKDTTGGTRTGALGTFGFAAPEVLRRAKDAGPAADVYALAMTAMYALSRGELDYFHVVQKPERVVEELPCPASVKATLLRGIALEVQDRLASAADFCRALAVSEERAAAPEASPAVAEITEESRADAVISGPRDELRAHSWTQPAEKRRRTKAQRRRLWLLVAALVAGIGAVGLVLATSGGGPPRLEASPEPDVADAQATSSDVGRGGFVGISGSWGDAGDAGPVTDTAYAPAGLDVEDRETFVQIQPGSFKMGSPAGEDGRWEHEGPQHKVTITRAFWLQKTEVTQAEWQALMGNNPSRFGGCEGLCPVENVSWWDAVAYANELSKKEGLEPCYKVEDCSGEPGTGEGHYQCGSVKFVGLTCRGYRLPTEAEWEYAARAGSEAARHGQLDAIAWYGANAGGKTQPVAGMAPNAWRLHDMLGNVYEWVWDRWGGSYSKEWQHDPMGPPTGSQRVIRGGCWYSDARHMRAALREGNAPDYRAFDLGFRLARSAP